MEKGYKILGNYIRLVDERNRDLSVTKLLGVSTNVFDYAFSYDDLAHISDEQADQLSNVIVEENDVLFNIRRK